MIKFLIVFILAVPTIILLNKHTDWSSELITQFVIVVVIFAAGYFLIKAATSCVKLIGIILIIFALIAYFYTSIQPFFTGLIFGPKL